MVFHRRWTTKLYVQKELVYVLDYDYLNPFSVYLESEDVYNLSSGKVYEGDAEKLVKILALGEIKAKAFIDERIKSTTKLFHDTFPRQNPTWSRDQHVKISNKDHSKEVIKVNRDLLGKLLLLSGKFHKPINFQEALTYPLCSVPLSLVFPDGTKRTSKSELLEIIVPESNAGEIM